MTVTSMFGSGLPGVETGSLIKLIKGAYGLREAPRLWYLKAKETIEEAGFEELRTGRGGFVLRDRTGPEPKLVAILVLHVDDAIHAGYAPVYENACKYIFDHLSIGRHGQDDFTFLGWHVVQLEDGTIMLDQKAFGTPSTM